MLWCAVPTYGRTQTLKSRTSEPDIRLKFWDSEMIITIASEMILELRSLEEWEGLILVKLY